MDSKYSNIRSKALLATTFISGKEWTYIRDYDTTEDLQMLHLYDWATCEIKFGGTQLHK